MYALAHEVWLVVRYEPDADNGDVYVLRDHAVEDARKRNEGEKYSADARWGAGRVLLRGPAHLLREPGMAP